VTSRFREARRGRGVAQAIRAGLLSLSAVVAGALLTIPGSLPAAADPALTVAEAKAQIEQLQTDSAAIDQDYVGVQEQINQAKAKLALKHSDVQLQAERVTKLKAQVGQVALAQFQNRNLDTAAQLFVTKDTEGFLSQISTVEKVNENQNSVLQDYQQEQASLADLEHSTQTDLAALSEQEKELNKLRASSDAKLAEAKAVLAKLTSAEQDRLAAEQKKADAQALVAGDTSNPTSNDPPATTGTGRGAKALAFARAQLGKPYRFGASGPNAYDCSGLTGAAWRAAGVTLPRTSYQQFHAGRYVAKSDLQPGDLVFFYSSTRPSHVALYVGNGMVIHAPHPGASVRYIKMKYMPYSGARRPG
jgi:cell wall-associated NlpC family hydrolase